MRIELFILRKHFLKSLRKLDKKIYKEFVKKKDLLLINSHDPSLNLHPLHGEWRGFWSINVTGNMRAVFKVQGKVVIFFDIGSHSELYE